MPEKPHYNYGDIISGERHGTAFKETDINQVEKCMRTGTEFWTPVAVVRSQKLEMNHKNVKVYWLEEAHKMSTDTLNTITGAVSALTDAWNEEERINEKEAYFEQFREYAQLN